MLIRVFIALVWGLHFLPLRALASLGASVGEILSNAARSA